MNTTSRHPLALLALSALTGWLTLIVVWATYVFLLPHGLHFAPELGPLGVFVVFGMVYSFFFLLDFLLITVPCFLFFHRRIRPGPLLRGICGAGLFCLSVPVWILISSTSNSDILFCMAFAAVAGAASFIALRPIKLTANAA